jgi:hypothetical protein
MIDINPQLQSKIFDSLLLHMKAERKGAHFVPPAAGVKRPANTPPSQWDGLAEDLQRLGLNKTTADALVSWATSQAEQSRTSPVKIRVLHPMEREFISIEAYDYLLELYRLGLIGPPQLEMLIENCAFLTSLPATRVQISKMALRTFTENLELQGLGSSH